MRSASPITLLLAVAPISCQTGSMGTKEGADGLIGSRFSVGTLLGAFVGREIGSSLDKADQQYADSAVAQAYSALIGQRIAWNNPQSGNQGAIVPIRDGYADSGTYCREFKQTIVVGGRTEQAHDAACRQPDGSWKIAD